MTYSIMPLPKEDGISYFKRKLHTSIGDDLKGLIAFRGDTKLAAVVGLHDWTDTACWGHWIIEDPFVLRHGFFEAVCDYVFVQLARQKMFGKITAQNVRSLRLAEKVGFTEVARLKDGFKEGVDFIIVELTKDNCRYL